LEVLRMARYQEKENLSGKMEINMKDTLKMIISMDLAFTTIQKKMQETTVKVIGIMARCQEKENLFGKMEKNMRETLKII
jgi:hypothetical protein